MVLKKKHVKEKGTGNTTYTLEVLEYQVDILYMRVMVRGGRNAIISGGNIVGYETCGVN
jgi:hypothetical protein